MSSADYLCKLFGPGGSGSKLFYTLMVFLKEFCLKMLIYDKMLPAGKALIERRGYCVTNQLLRSISNVKGVVKINGVCLGKEIMCVFGMS